MYDRENFKLYVGGNSGASYIAGLRKVEEEFGISLDEEFGFDRCEELIGLIEQKKKDASLTSMERKYWTDRCSHVRKYVEYKSQLSTEKAAKTERSFRIWFAEQPQRDDPSKVYSDITITAAINLLRSGLRALGVSGYEVVNCFNVTDVVRFQALYDDCYNAAEKFDKKHGHRDFRNGLEFYLKFLNANKTNFKIREIVNAYKADFKRIDEEERYKWEAIKHYKNNWNIDANDFAEMLEKAFSKTYNLLTAGQYFARKMLVAFSKEHPEEVRSLFKMLYDESLPLAKRFDDFRAGFDAFTEGQKINHYQDLHAVSVYLTFEYPEKYYIYKYGVWTEFLKNIGETIPSTSGKHETFKIESSNKLCDEILNVVLEEAELCSMSRSRLDNSCYEDPKYRMLAFDIMFYGSNYESEEIDSWWPSLEEYNPNLSKEDWIKYILEIEKPEHPCPMQMLRAMMELGGIASCKQLSQKFGGTTSYYVGCTMNLGRRVKKFFDLPACIDEGQERYFPFPFLGKALDNEEGHQYLYKTRPELLDALNEIDLSDISPYYDKGVENMKTDINKNTILYGPPGTGKTYITARYAVAIVENKPLEALEDIPYDEIIKKYNEYKAQGRIEFTTFHQSYGYEEFIEGIKPVLEISEEDNNDIKYEVASGVFKRFCDIAGQPVVKGKNLDVGLNKNPTVWKVSLWSTGDNPIRTECMENGHIRIGWDDYGPDITSETDFSEMGGRNVLNSFIYKMKVGDIVLSCYSSTTIDAVGVVTGEYEWNGEYDDLNRVRKVNWLVKGINESIVDMNNGSVMTLASVYRLNISVADALSIVEKHGGFAEEYEAEKENHVFIIDEINRGNISKIFGELITLIEPTKRLGQEEAVKVKLPYSQKLFGVPDNVYIIGTMNTADRSIAAIDTALRRRFAFEEMMPDSTVLEGLHVDGVSISNLLDLINERIEVLYDREHTIGHAYFTPLLKNNNREVLFDIFRNKILPLLQEYFYEDYEKIRLVLGDNQKSDKALQFINEETVDYGKLFGSNIYDYDDKKVYTINEDAFENIEAYKEILKGRQ